MFPKHWHYSHLSRYTLHSLSMWFLGSKSAPHAYTDSIFTTFAISQYRLTFDLSTSCLSPISDKHRPWVIHLWLQFHQNSSTITELPVRIQSLPHGSWFAVGGCCRTFWPVFSLFFLLYHFVPWLLQLPWALAFIDPNTSTLPSLVTGPSNCERLVPYSNL